MEGEREIERSDEVRAPLSCIIDSKGRSGSIIRSTRKIEAETVMAVSPIPGLEIRGGGKLRTFFLLLPLLDLGDGSEEEVGLGRDFPERGATWP